MKFSDIINLWIYIQSTSYEKQELSSLIRTQIHLPILVSTNLEVVPVYNGTLKFLNFK